MKRNVDGRPVPRHQAHRRAQAAARAFPADHDLIPPDAQLPDVILHIDQRQQVIAFDQLGILVQNFAKLNSSHILMTFPAQV